MTTLVWDGYDLAAERKVTSSEFNGILGYAKKIISLDNGGYVAGAGNYDVLFMVADWLNGHRDTPTDDQMKNSSVIYVNPVGEVFVYDSSCSYATPAFKWEVYGTGSGYALAALHAGKTAEEAVKIASRIDVYSGGKVDVVHVNSRPQKKAKA